MMPQSCFKAYDIRGRVPDQLDADLARRIGRAYARVIRPRGPVAVGRDNRHSSPELAAALIEGLNAAGVSTQELGLCGTEMIYHAAAGADMGGGIMVTASHNPKDYNGMKLVRRQARPISGDTGLREIEAAATDPDPPPDHGPAAANTGRDIMADYVAKVLSFLDHDRRDRLAPLHLVVDSGNGCAGPAFDAIAEHLPFTVTRINHQPDENFPNGIPNPLLPENREATAAAVREHDADMGIAWDGDFDRCFFFDEQGRFIEGYYLVGLLAARLLQRHPGQKIIHDPRLTWNTVDMVRAAGGTPVLSKTGHAFIKERMRQEDALYGGEMSAHHYFRDFAYCDSGMIPWLLVAEQISAANKPLSTLVDERLRAYPCSGELNFQVEDPAATMKRVLAAFQDQNPTIDHTDGISAEFPAWRFNLRGSNTEPVLRLNVETRADQQLLTQRTAQLTSLIR